MLIVSNEFVMFTCSNDKTIRKWSLGTQKCLQVISIHEGPVNGIAFYNNRLFSCSFDTTIIEYSFETNAIIHKYEGHKNNIHTMHLKTFGKPEIFSISSDNSIIVWDIETKEKII